MKDLRRYITKREKYSLKFDQTILNDSIHAMVSYLLINSFNTFEDHSKSYLQMYDEGYDFYLFLSETSCYHYEDFELPLDFTQKLVLSAMLPEYIFDENLFYVSDLSDEEEKMIFEESKEEAKNFMRKHKLTLKTRKELIDFIDNNVSDGTQFCINVVRSKWLRKIFRDKDLKNLFESALGGQFDKPDTFCACWCLYNDVGGLEDQVDALSLYKFIELFKVKIKAPRRKHDENYNFASNVYKCENYVTKVSALIDSLLTNYDTRTEVMF